MTIRVSTTPRLYDRVFLVTRKEDLRPVCTRAVGFSDLPECGTHPAARIEVAR
jgi:hypothetical protein